MTCPLGSFPRFGHQDRWASERRYRAIVNSIATRKAVAADHLRNEIALHAVFSRVLQGMKALNDESQRELDEMNRRMESIHRRHVAGKRVYYRVFTEILLYCSAAAGTHPELKGMSLEQLKLIVEDIATRCLRGESVLHYTDARCQAD